MTAITVQVDDDMAEELRRWAGAQKRSETDVIREGLAEMKVKAVLKE